MVQIFATQSSIASQGIERYALSLEVRLLLLRAGQISLATAGIQSGGALEPGDRKMKKLFFLCVVCGFCATGAMAQIGGTLMSAPTTSPLVISGHVQHASQTALASSQNLIGHFSVASGKGERPLWEVMPPSAPETPLGDVARAIRKEHADAKKAVVVWTN